MSQESTKNCLEVRRDLVRPAALAFMGACLLIAAIAAAFAPLPSVENELMTRIFMGYLGLPVSCGIIAFNVWSLAHRRNALVIDGRGITDNTTALSSGHTSWEQISEVYVLRLKDGDFLCAVPTDYDAWLAARTKGQRMLAQANHDSGFAPIRIQFAKVAGGVTAPDALAVVKRIRPGVVTRTRKPRY